MSQEESFEPGMEREDREDELDPVKDLFNALGEKERKINDAVREAPTVEIDDTAGGYSVPSERARLFSGRSLPKPSDEQPFASEQLGIPLKRVGSRSLISRLISKLFASRS